MSEQTDTIKKAKFEVYEEMLTLAAEWKASGLAAGEWLEDRVRELKRRSVEKADEQGT